MMAIFSYMVGNILEVFIDFSIFEDSFNFCLHHMSHVLQHCQETNLVLNLEKCRFMIQEGVFLGHKIASKGIEVDRAKVKAIKKLSPPTSIKGIKVSLVMPDSTRD